MNVQKQALHYLKVTRYQAPTGRISDYTHLPRPFSSIAWMEKGYADFTTEEGTVRVMPGDLIFTPVGCTYRSVWLGEPDTQILSCHFRFSPSAEPFRNKQFPLQRVSGGELFSDDFHYLLEHIGEPDSAFAVISRFYGLCHEITSRMVSRLTPPLDPRIAAAVSFLEEHYAEPVAIPALAAHCNVSPSYFYELFRNSTGLSPIAYKQRICIRHAELLLADEPSLSIEEISEALGFESSNYFRRVFHNATGMSPREYRKNPSLSV